MRRLLPLLLMCGCARPVVAPAHDAGGAVAAAVADAGIFIPTAAWADATEANACQSCHSQMLMEQQRLTAAQWASALKKMQGFGAAIADHEVAPLSEQLTGRRGPSAPLPSLARVDAATAAAGFAVLDDGPLAGGDAAQGKVVYETRCLACHGADAHGGIGVNLVDRLMLQRAPEFAAYVRTGRGLMPPQADLSDAQLGQVLAYLRTR